MFCAEGCGAGLSKQGSECAAICFFFGCLFYNFLGSFDYLLSRNWPLFKARYVLRTLPQTDLARLYNVSRQSIRKWQDKDSVNDASQRPNTMHRLNGNRPVLVPKGTKITNDSVSLGAGREKGSIKKFWEFFADLILAIDATVTEHSASEDAKEEKLAKRKAQANRYRALYEDAIAREICLLKENFALKRELKRIGAPIVLT